MLRDVFLGSRLQDEVFSMRFITVLVPVLFVFVPPVLVRIVMKTAVLQNVAFSDSTLARLLCRQVTIKTFRFFRRLTML